MSGRRRTPRLPSRPSVEGRARDVRRPWAGEAFRQRISSDVAKAFPLCALWARVNAGQRENATLGPHLLLQEQTMIRDDIKAATIAAMKGGDKETTATLRMASAAVKNRDIEVRTGGAPASDDQLVTEVLQKMVKQRRESAEIYRNNGRDDRAQVEEAEIAVIDRFLPRQLSDAEAEAQIRAIVSETGASSLKDMGRAMSLLKERLTAPHQLDTACCRG